MHALVLLLVLVASSAVGLLACGPAQDPTTAPQGDFCTDPTVGRVESFGHTHAGVRLCREDLESESAVGVLLDAVEQDHTHTVLLTPEQIGAVYEGTTVTVLSTRAAGHTHRVSFSR